MIPLEPLSKVRRANTRGCLVHILCHGSLWPSLRQYHRRNDCNFVLSLEINRSASFSTLFWLTSFAFLYRI